MESPTQVTYTGHLSLKSARLKVDRYIQFALNVCCRSRTGIEGTVYRIEAELRTAWDKLDGFFKICTNRHGHLTGYEVRKLHVRKRAKVIHLHVAIRGIERECEAARREDLIVDRAGSKDRIGKIDDLEEGFLDLTTRDLVLVIHEARVRGHIRTRLIRFWDRWVVRLRSNSDRDRHGECCCVCKFLAAGEADRGYGHCKNEGKCAKARN